MVKDSALDTIFSPSTITYCGVITLQPDTLNDATVKIKINIKVTTNHRINVHFLNFNFQWVDIECGAYVITVLEASNINILCFAASAYHEPS